MAGRTCSPGFNPSFQAEFVHQLKESAVSVRMYSINFARLF